MWVKGQQDYIDGKTGHHVIFCINNVTGAEHRIQIPLGHSACPHCGSTHAPTGIDSIDPKAIVEAELAKLNEAHRQIKAYAEKHRVKVK